MKTKKEICRETGISESTFTFWQGKGLIPPPDGIEKRSALWDDVTVETIHFIQNKQAAGLSLEAISAALPEFYKQKMLESQKIVDRLSSWDDETTAKEKLAEILGFHPGECPGIMGGRSGGRDYVYVAVAHDGVVTFAKIELHNDGKEEVVQKKDIPIAVYATFVQMRIIREAERGRILNTHGDAFVVLSALLENDLASAYKITEAREKILENAKTLMDVSK